MVTRKQGRSQNRGSRRTANSRNKNVTVQSGVPREYANATHSIHIGRTNLAEAACSQIDAFCEKAKNAKIYDIASNRTGTIQLRGARSFANQSDGIRIAQFSASTYEAWRQATTVVADVPTVWSTYNSATDYATLNTLSDSYRVVSWGLRVQSNCNTDGATGILRVQVMPDQSNINIASTMVMESTMTPLLGADITVLCKPLSKEYTNFEINAFTAANASKQWPIIQISTDGEPSLPAYSVQWVYNVEYTPKSSYASTATAANIASPAVTTVSNYVQGTTDTILNMGAHAAGEFIKRTATRAAASYFGVGPLAMVPYVN